MLAGLKRLHDGMMRGMKMFGGMLVLGTVAAADVSTFKAETEVNPSVTHFETFLAAGTARLNLANLVKVRTLVRHRHPPLFGLRLSQFFAATRL
jgi:hypothetical protein